MFKFLNSKLYYYIALPLVAFIIVPGFFVSQNINELIDINSFIFILFLMIYFALSVLLLILSGKILAKFNKEEYFLYLVKFSFFYVFLAGLFSPVTVSGLIILKYYTPIDYPNIFFAVALSIVLLLLSRTKHKSTLDIVILTVLTINFFISINAFVDLSNKWSSHIEKLSQRSDDKSIFDISSSPGNIFIFSLDAIPRNQFNEVIKNNDKYKNAFKDFTIYENVTGVFPATIASITDELYGNASTIGKADNDKDFMNLNPEKLMTNVLNNNGYDVSTYGAYEIGFSDKSKVFTRGTLLNEINPVDSLFKIFDAYDYIISRIFTSVSLRIKKKFITNVGFDNKLFEFVIYLISDDSPYNELYYKLALSPGISYEYIRGNDIIELEMYIDELKIKDDTVPTAHFVHNPLTHFPIAVDKNCNYIAHVDNWYDSMVTPEGNMGGTLCAAESVTKFINKLKELGVYDDSLIIFKSDHGRHQQFYDRKSMESFKLYNHQSFGYNRLLPVLMIKDYNKQAKDVSFNGEPVVLGDLAKTLCVNSNIKVDCEQYPGFNLLEDNLSIPTTAKAYYHIINRDRINGYKLEDTFEIELYRKKDFFNNINNFIVDEFIIEQISCNEKVLFNTGEAYQNGLTDNKSWAKWYDMEKVGLRVNMAECSEGSELIFYYDGDSDVIGQLKLNINGNDLTNQVKLLKMENGKYYYSAIITSKYLSGKSNELIELGDNEIPLDGDFEFVSIGRRSI